MKTINNFATLSVIVGIILRIIGFISLKIMLVFFIPAFALMLIGFVDGFKNNNPKRPQ